MLDLLAPLHANTTILKMYVCMLYVCMYVCVCVCLSVCGFLADERPVILAADMPEKLQQDALECSARAIYESSDHEVWAPYVVVDQKRAGRVGYLRSMPLFIHSKERCFSARSLVGTGNPRFLPAAVQGDEQQTLSGGVRNNSSTLTFD